MRRIISWFVLLAMCAMFLSGCGEKSCNHVGDRKYADGHTYVCKDSGMGLTWVEK